MKNAWVAKEREQGRKRREAVRRMLEAGLTQGQIATKLGVSQQRVWQLVHEEEWSAYMRKGAAKKLERARKRYAARKAAGMTRDEILKPKKKGIGTRLESDALEAN